MHSQIVFKIDKQLKNSAMAKARAQGVSISTVLKEATRSFVEGKIRVGIVTSEETPTTSTTKTWDNAKRDAQKGRHLSATFSDAKSTIAYLKEHAR
ncbi:MAG: hypothetical protein AAB468_01685 [Patescibacteria group bacterium]